MYFQNEPNSSKVEQIHPNLKEKPGFNDSG